MRHRNPNLSWIRTVLADPEPRRDDPQSVVVINIRDGRRARLIPDVNAMNDLMPDLDTELADGIIEE